jgi:membrane dipeptidase
MRRILMMAAAIAVVTCGPAAAQDEVSRADRALHERLLVLDTHLDTPANLGRPGWSIGDDHSAEGPLSHVDLPRMERGGLDGGFWVIYTPQGPLTPEGMRAARDQALERATWIREMVARHDDKMALALTSDDAARIAAAGKRVVYMSIENSYPLENDLTLLQTFYRLGVRMAGPVHSADNQYGDSTTGKGTWGGLSPLGVQWVAEANRLGIVVDGSHSSDKAIDQMIGLSKTPLILSHHGCRELHSHPRNLDDPRLKRLAETGGVIQINSVSNFLITTSSDAGYDKALAALNARYPAAGRLTPAQARALSRDRAELDRRFNRPQATFEHYMQHVLHALKLMGVDHVGLGADWDGGGGVVGMEDVTDLPKITARLRAAGYSEADIAKVMGGNTLRLLKAAEDHAKTYSRVD